MTSGRLQEDFMKTSGRLQEDFRKTSGTLQEDFRMIKSKAYMKILELACSFMTLYAVAVLV